MYLNKIEYFSSEPDLLKFNKVQVIKEKDTIRIFFSKELAPGCGKLRIEFSGKLNENLNGFYKTRCLNRHGVLGHAAVTQFEVRKLNSLP